MARFPDGLGHYFDDTQGVWFNDDGTLYVEPGGGTAVSGGGTGGGFDWGSGSGPRTIEGNGPEGYGKYVLNADGTLGAFIVSSIRPSTGSTTIVNASTGGAHYTTMYGPEGYGTYETSTGTPILVGTKADPNAVPTDPRDKNNDQIDDSTGYALGVFKDTSGTSPSGYYYDPGNGALVPVTPKGAAYSGPDLFPDKAGSAQVVGSAGGGYYERQKNGTWKLVIPGTSGPGSSGGGSTYSGGGGGGSPGGGLTGGRTSTTVHEGGFNDVRTTNSTSYNTSDIGPNSLANSAAERAQRASEFAATYGLNRSKEQRDAAATYAQLLSQVDPNAYQAFLEANGGGRLDNALLSGGNALSTNALRPAALALEGLRGGPGGGLTGLATGGGVDSAAAGAGGGGIPSGGIGPPAAGNAPAAPLTSAQARAVQGVTTFATPEEYAAYRAATDQTPEQLAYNQLHAGEQGAIWGGDYGGRTDLSKYYGLANNIMNGRIAGTQTVDPYGAGYAGAGKGVIGTASVLPPVQPNSLGLTGEAGAAQQGLDAFRRGDKNIAPEWLKTYGPGAINDLTKSSISGTGVATNPTKPLDPSGYHGGDPNYRYDAITGTYVHLAHGGLTRAPQMIVGDPQADGGPNPEVILNPTNAPISVMPVRGMGGLTGMRHMMADGTMMAGPPMGSGGGLTRLPHYAYGSFSPSYDQMTAYQQWLAAQNAEPTTTAAPTQTATATAPVTQTAAAPATTTTAASTTQTAAPATTATVSPPTQIGNYSTAPGTAGQPVQTAPTPATAPTASSSVYSAPPPQTAPVATAEPSQSAFDEVLYTRLAATNPWMANPSAFTNVDYLSRDPVARHLYEQFLTLRYGVPQESIDFAIARNRLAGSSLAGMSQGR